jgi:decaprenylphospho-beta-D-erythro-pentofuranosid-2-ulose 2-reductase
MKKIIVIGATSTIAEATCRLFAAEGDMLYLVGRNEVSLKEISEDLKLRGANAIKYQVQDLNTISKHNEIFDKANHFMGGIDLIFIAHGTLPDQTGCEKSVEKTINEFNTNAISVISLLTHASNIFEAYSKGMIVVISSVAGDRGRKSNYIYGSAKGSVSIFLEGLRGRLDKNGVRVITIKPGFVDTNMTKGLNKNFLWSSPDKVARGIKGAIDNKKDVVYLPGYWKYIMYIIKLIPGFIFKKLSL